MIFKIQSNLEVMIFQNPIKRGSYYPESNTTRNLYIFSDLNIILVKYFKIYGSTYKILLDIFLSPNTVSKIYPDFYFHFAMHGTIYDIIQISDNKYCFGRDMFTIWNMEMNENEIIIDMKEDILKLILLSNDHILIKLRRKGLIIYNFRTGSFSELDEINGIFDMSESGLTYIYEYIDIYNKIFINLYI